MELPSVQHCDTSRRNSWPWWSIGAMQQRGAKTTVMPWRAVELKDFLKVKVVEYQWNTGLMATRNPARKTSWSMNLSINIQGISKFRTSQWKIYGFLLHKRAKILKISANSGVFQGLEMIPSHSWNSSKTMTMKKRETLGFLGKPRLFLGTCNFIGSRFYCSTGKRNYGCLEKHEIIMP